MFKIAIENYRGFSNEIFDIRKINILIGENSSGKSSLIKFLLTLVNSFGHTNSSFNFGVARIGKYSEFVFEHKSELPISFTIYLGKEYIDFISNNFEDDESWRSQIDQIRSLPPNFKNFVLSTHLTRMFIKPIML